MCVGEGGKGGCLGEGEEGVWTQSFGIQVRRGGPARREPGSIPTHGPYKSRIHLDALLPFHHARPFPHTIHAPSSRRPSRPWRAR
ncbi:hypothetical protein F751_1478 [Auxenochlorella protothecoides]|uniref:Uncharacterized protein n=1 Tax=Auxenochlorella protothecoides TaxID=3075 RepID=A0A087SJG0_AUXPR|nr:hypothetical protein F751_1478 [Auxenochlorella protothecoides]KFM25864.1 hypothetical protein F751_1478 [Auxenochlorella protothecoides]